MPQAPSDQENLDGAGGAGQSLLILDSGLPTHAWDCNADPCLEMATAQDAPIIGPTMTIGRVS